MHLTATEYTLLQSLVLNAGKVLTHRQLERNPLQPQYIVTGPGVGYRLRMPGAEPNE